MNKFKTSYVLGKMSLACPSSHGDMLIVLRALGCETQLGFICGHLSSVERRSRFLPATFKLAKT